jgi:hypothetical protein
MRVWLDDLRAMPEGFDLHCKTIEEVLPYLSKITFISFDNDLGEGLKEGHHLAAMIEEKAYFKEINPFDWQVHSSNPNGRDRIFIAMANADKYWGRKKTTVKLVDYLRDYVHSGLVK